MFWAASVALVRSWEAKSIAICASSTVTTALSGSLAVPVASDWAALSELNWVLSSEEIASESSLPKLPDPPLDAPPTPPVPSTPLDSFDPRVVPSRPLLPSSPSPEPVGLSALAALGQAADRLWRDAVRETFGEFARQSADRRDDHLSTPSVALNIDLAVCIAVTSD